MKYSEINRPTTVLSVIERIYLRQSFDPRYETGCIYSYRSVDYRGEKWTRVDWEGEEEFLLVRGLVRDCGDEEAECLWFDDEESAEPDALCRVPLMSLEFMLEIS